MIRNAKGHKDRIISISGDMAVLLEKYQHFIKITIPGQEKWLFPAADPSCHLSSGALGDRFNQFWNQTSCATGCSRKPTIHSLRHTFVVIRINAWMEQGLIPLSCSLILAGTLDISQPMKLFITITRSWNPWRLSDGKIGFLHLCCRR